MGKTKDTDDLPIVKAKTLARPNSFLLFGEPKRGKSSLSASIIKVPGVKNVLLIDIDKGSAAIAQDYPDIDVKKFKRGDIKGFQRFWDQLVADDGMVNGVQYDAIILDTLSVLQQWAEAGAETGANKYQKWDDLKKFTLNTMWQLHDMTPIGIACLHTKYQSIMVGAGKEDDEYVKLNPAVQGSAGVHIGAIPDVIGFCDVREAEDDDPEEDIVYFVQLKPGERTNTGNRFKGLPDRLEDPSMKRIFELIAERKAK